MTTHMNMRRLFAFGLLLSLSALVGWGFVCMSHGTPDWWGAAPKSTTYGLNDMAELAVRLGSPVSYDRRGDVVCLDQFEDGVGRWEEVGDGDDNEEYPVAYPTHSGKMALMLHSGDAVGNSGAILRELPYPTLSKLGAEVSFIVYAGTDEVRLWMLLYQGTHYYDSFLSYHHDDGTIWIRTQDADIEIATPGIVQEGYTHFNTMKFVMDALTGKYVRAIFNDHNYPLDAYNMYYGDDVSPKRVALWVVNWTGTTGGTNVLIDDFIFTQNEP